MKAYGNNDVKVCVANLFRCRRGECFLVRDKGMDGSFIDRTNPDEAQMIYDAMQLVERFEHPSRVKAIDVTLDREKNLTIEAGVYSG